MLTFEPGPFCEPAHGLQPDAAVFVHEGSTLVVIANALRLLLYEA